MCCVKSNCIFDDGITDLHATWVQFVSDEKSPSRSIDFELFRI